MHLRLFVNVKEIIGFYQINKFRMSAKTVLKKLVLTTSDLYEGRKIVRMARILRNVPLVQSELDLQTDYRFSVSFNKI
jgi:hypothetical protein